MVEAVSSRRTRLGSTGLSDVDKSAVVLLSIGEEAATEVMKHMTEREKNLISLAMARISHVSQADMTTVFHEFVDRMLEETSVGAGADATRLAGGDYLAGTEAGQPEDPRALAATLGCEQPQVAAAILASMEPERADAVIQHLPAEMVEQIVPRLATQVRVSSGVAGMAARILRRIDAGRAEAILKQIEALDAGLANAIRAEGIKSEPDNDGMFVFEDLELLDDRSLQMVLRAVDRGLLASALKGASPTLLGKIMRNLSPRSVQMLRGEIAALGPMPASQLDAVKREIIAVAQRLEREGTIILSADIGELVA